MTHFFSTPEQGQKLKELGIETKYHWHYKNGWHLHDLPMTDESDVPAMTAEEALEMLGAEYSVKKEGRHWIYRGWCCEKLDPIDGECLRCAYGPTLAQACVDMIIKVKG